MLKRAILGLLAVFASTAMMADPGDTLVVQTYTFEDQNNPDTNYDSPGRRTFTFPENDGTTYQKILMYYTLKCFEDGTAGGLGFPCGEWDYLTYNYLYDYTGVLDSNFLTHPFMLIDNQDFETQDLVVDPLYNFIQYDYEIANEVTVENEVMVTFAEDGTVNPAPVRTDTHRSRFQFLYTAQELLDMGLTAGEIGYIELEIDDAWDLADLLRLKVGATAEEDLTSWYDGDMTEVRVGEFMPGGEGWYPFQFTEAIMWDGMSSLVFELSAHVEEALSPTQFKGVNSTINSVSAASNDRYIAFNNVDEVKVPGEAFAGVQDEITIAFWVNGDEDIQPSNSTVFEGVNSSNQRVVNSHLPWGNARVYWDAGQSGGYDRIDKAANTADFEGRWNHWAFTKNAVTGEMYAYLNGELWHSGTDRFRTMEDIVKFSIGSAAGWSNFYNGKMDEFAIWDVALNEETIAAWMNRSITMDHPNYDDLVVYYDFNEVNGEPVLDHSGNGFDAAPHGAPDRQYHNGDDLFLNPELVAFRPSIQIQQGDYTINTTTDSYTEQVMVAPVSVSSWDVENYDVYVTDIDYYWLPQDTYVYDEDGNILETIPFEGDAVPFVNQTLEYYGAPYEVVDRYEIGRFITPYGINLDLEEGWTWIFDVTDYEPLLHGEVELEAGNWQELLDMKFMFIEGTPPRDVKRVEAFWKGTYNLNSFDDNVTAYQIDVEEGEETFRLKTRASGHGFGQGNNCGEFCYNTHSVKVNGETQWSWEIMQECADNPLYPQGGTWIYDRAGWCPGAPVKTQDFELTPLVDNMDSFTVDYDIEYDPDGNYRFEGQVIAYGEPNFTTDVEIEEIMAPSDMRILSRMNPICDDPVIRIKNNGSAPLTSCEITYGIGENMNTYTWTGELGFLESEDVTVSYDDPGFWNGDEEEVLVFEATVTSANGVTDDNQFNNHATSTFNRPPVYTYGDEDDNRIIIWTKTNNTPWETEVRIETMNGTTVYLRDDFDEANTNYRDTIALNAGCYKFILSDSDDDGLSFFANNDGNGTCRLKKVAGSTFIQFETDFGKEIVHYFNFQTDLVSVDEEFKPEPTVVVFPNPGTDRCNVKISGMEQDISYRMFDVNGKLVASGNRKLAGGGLLSIDTYDLPAGMYSVIIDDGEQYVTRRWLK
ncbi:MAG: T9SS type A sorting domain-containing protein [Flavobacteriales bacterium]|nr:T9SS type A sorting domain-containing protein [Flavobacteriales bacterium]